MTREELALKIVEISKLKGTFQLRSGKTANEYFDKYRFESNPVLLTEITRMIIPMLPKSCQILAGLELGGIPLSTSLSIQTGIPQVFVRKKAKEYGTCQFAEGIEIKGKKLCLVEDVITTGGQVIQSAKDLRASGAIVEDVVCVILREGYGESQLQENHLKLKYLFHQSEL